MWPQGPLVVVNDDQRDPAVASKQPNTGRLRPRLKGRGDSIRK